MFNQNDIHPLGNKSMWLIKTKIDENRFPPGLTGICLFESLVNLITGKIYILYEYRFSKMSTQNGNKC